VRHLVRLGTQRLAVPDLVPEVRAIQRGAGDDGVGAKAQRVDDVSRRLGRRRRRQGVDRGRAEELLAKAAQGEVRGAKIVAPLRRAVRLVDDQRAQRAFASARGERVAESAGAAERLGGGEEHRRRRAAVLEGDAEVRLDRGEVLGGRLARPRRALDAEVAAPLELVAREREEGRTDDGDARLARVGAHQRGEHVREALARARGKEREAVAPGEGGLDRLELTRAEIRARAEVRAERSKRRALEVVGAFEVVHGCEEKTPRRAERSLGAHARADDHVVRAEEDRAADGADDGPPVLGVGPAKGGGAREYSWGRDVRTQL